jgi:hypothetical protein
VISDVIVVSWLLQVRDFANAGTVAKSGAQTNTIFKIDFKKISPLIKRILHWWIWNS